MSALLIRQFLKEKKHTKNVYGEKCDSNGYIPNVFGFEDGVCAYCNRVGDTVRHELYQGNPDRQTSKAIGAWLPLCPDHHTLFHQDERINAKWQKKFQAAFEKEHEHEDFINLIGKNYL